jgi:hypothetical protein
MKIIITENQNKKLSYLRRLTDIMYEAAYMIDDADEFYGDVDFCTHYPTLVRFVEDVVYEIINQYVHPIYDNDDTVNFIYDHIGYKNFINIMMDEHGEKIRNFYKERTRGCI